MKRSKWVAALCLIAMFGLAGCSSSSDDPPRIPDPGVTEIDDPEAFESDFNQMMQQIVIPIVGTLGTFDPFNPVVVASRMGGPEGGIGCEDISGEVGCIAGSAERCPTGINQLTVSFDVCETVDGYVVDGDVVASETPPTAEADWNVTVTTPQVGDVTLVGSADLTESETSLVAVLNMQATLSAGTATLVGRLSATDVGEGCVQQQATGLELFSPGFIFVLNGALTYCDPGGWPDGLRTVTMVDSTTDFRFEMTWVSDDLEVTTDVRDNSSSSLLAVCVTDLSIDPAPSDCTVLED